MSSQSSPLSPTFSELSAFSDPQLRPAGLLWVSSRITDASLPIETLDAWYAEHERDILNCPGNGGRKCFLGFPLFLRYNNLTTHPIPTNAEDVANLRPWSFLTLVKLTNTSWLSSPQFLSVPHNSAILPKRPDGSLGYISDVTLAALRAYEIAPRYGDDSGFPSGGPKFLISIQTSILGGSLWEFEKQLAKVEGFEGRLGCRFDKGAVLHFEESGGVPDGLFFFAFDGKEAPELDLQSLDKHADRVDIWELRSAAGDTSLNLGG
ncbi:MAG: hypothetical protein Q9227_009555 [Pyrenula ochraceoflavens]